MHLPTTLGVLLLICCLTIDAQNLDCNMFKRRCEACVQRLRDPKNEMTILNDECRQKLIRRWIWRNQNRCDIQSIACRANNQRLDCQTIAMMARMRRIE